jgi:hypothetical protein
MSSGLEVGYDLILCDGFRRRPPSVGYVVLYVAEIAFEYGCILFFVLEVQSGPNDKYHTLWQGLGRVEKNK